MPFLYNAAPIPRTSLGCTLKEILASHSCTMPPPFLDIYNKTKIRLVLLGNVIVQDSVALYRNRLYSNPHNSGTPPPPESLTTF